MEDLPCKREDPSYGRGGTWPGVRRQAQQRGDLTCGNNPTYLKKKVSDTIRKQSPCERLEERVILDTRHAYIYSQTAREKLSQRE